MTDNDGGPDVRVITVAVRLEITPIDGGFFRATSPDMPNCYAYERSADNAMLGFIMHCREVAEGRFDAASKNIDAMLKAREVKS